MSTFANLLRFIFCGLTSRNGSSDLLSESAENENGVEENIVDEVHVSDASDRIDMDCHDIIIQEENNISYVSAATQQIT